MASRKFRSFVSLGLVIVLLVVHVQSVSAIGTNLAVTGGAPGILTATLNGRTQTAYTTLGTFQASDTTLLNGPGWNITIQASQFTCTAGIGACPLGGRTLPRNSLLIAPPTVICATGTPCTFTSAPPTISIAGNTAIDTAGTTGVKVASAAANTGMGTYNFAPGRVDGIAGHNLKLTVPASAYATTYNSTVTMSIGSGP